MKNLDFLRLREEHTARRFDLCDVKSRDYTTGDNRLDNFYRLAGMYDVHPLKVLGIYLQKHQDSIARYIKTEAKEKYSESIEGRIHDAQNYFDLMLAMIQELKDLQKPEFQAGKNC